MNMFFKSQQISLEDVYQTVHRAERILKNLIPETTCFIHYQELGYVTQARLKDAVGIR